MTPYDIEKKSFINALWDIREPSRWTQGCSAKDAHGNPVRVDDRNAVCFCSIGALAHNSFDSYFTHGESGTVYHTYEDLIQALNIHIKTTRNVGVMDIVSFNDFSSYEDVIQLWVDTGISNGYLPAGFTMDQLESLRNSV